MKLFIDTSDREKLVLGLDEKRFEAKARDNKSQNLLPFLDEILKSEGKTVKEITEIKVNTGPGSFTGLRVGVTVAMTLGYSLGVKVNGKDIKKSGAVDINY
jgi:tRNA threonylcarbamoyladenosine biosynthesis protein TsaB